MKNGARTVESGTGLEARPDEKSQGKREINLANVFHDILQLVLSNFHLIGVLALFVLGVTLTYRTTNVVNFSQAITATIGAYMAGLWYVISDAAHGWL